MGVSCAADVGCGEEVEDVFGGLGKLPELDPVRVICGYILDVEATESRLE